MGLLRLGQDTPRLPPDRTVLEAVKVMTERHVGAIAVTEGERLVGIFTERDLMRRVVATERDPATTPLGEVMTRRVEAVSDSTSVAEAAQRMREHHFRHLPIIDGEGRLLGMVALRYLLYDLMDDLNQKVGDLQSFLMADGPGG
jgi:CBS domain-containing protein